MVMNHHRKAFLEYESLKAGKFLAEQVVLKAKKDFKNDPTNQKRFRLQDAIGRLNCVSKKVWCHEFKLKC